MEKISMSKLLLATGLLLAMGGQVNASDGKKPNLDDARMGRDILKDLLPENLDDARMGEDILKDLLPEDPSEAVLEGPPKEDGKKPNLDDARMGEDILKDLLPEDPSEAVLEGPPKEYVEKEELKKKLNDAFVVEDEDVEAFLKDIAGESAN